MKSASFLIAAACLAGAWLVPSAEARNRWEQHLAGFGMAGSDSSLSLRERRARMRALRDHTMRRHGPAFLPSAPLIGEAGRRALAAAVTRYRRIADTGGWPALAKGTYRIGDGGETIARLRRRLAITGDLGTVKRPNGDFDAGLEAAVARFQMRHGLTITGYVDRQTLAALNVPVNVRLRQLRGGLSQLRDLAGIGRSPRYVLVNIPAFMLQAVGNRGVELYSNVVVGKRSTRTPTISARIVELNFQPHWRVPETIARRDLIPQFRKDPGFFRKEHFSALPAWGAKPINARLIDWSSPEVRHYKFRQDPGPFNALGLVRINMPNKHIVYLHDTPLKNLFQRSARAFSSGCVRVQRITDLSAWLLREENGWSRMRVQTLIASGASENARLAKSVPVHFVYVTAWATGRGTAHFRRDIYGRRGIANLISGLDGDRVPGARAISP